MLLAASCIFYMWFVPKYILILLVTIIIDYGAGILIEKYRDQQRKKKTFLIISIISTCLVLIIFKYLNFFNQNVIYLSKVFGFAYPDKVINIILPIGLSFHTFQSLSYVIEVYRGHQKAERHFGYYSLYVMFYPQLVTGPIERPQNLLRQLHEEHRLNYDNIVKGLRLMLFGYFIKMVIADNLAPFVDQIYANPSGYNSWSIITGSFFYSFQIYCDFFGYSSIALGCAKVMGYDITDNFKNPYLATDIGDFWHRWHISLSTWFRDYLYIPLGGNRVKMPRWMLNIMVVFTLSGLWHGANWTFFLWGAAHGILSIIERLLKKLLKPLQFKHKAPALVLKGIKVIFTFIIVTALWMIFRAPDMQTLSSMWTSIFSNFSVKDTFYVPVNIYIYLLIFIVLDSLLFNTRFDRWCDSQKMTVRWIVYAILVFMTIAFASVNNFPFIYFQF